MTILIAALLATGLAGCWATNQRQEGPVVPEPPAKGAAPYLQQAGVAREAAPQLPTAIENALVLQDKYARALEDLSHEQQRTRDLTEENHKLSETEGKLQADLARAQQELAEANGLLLQMRQELEKWKADVLGFRDESRRVHEAELDALGKVMVLLGGEPPKPTTGSAGQAAAPAEKQAVASQPRPAAPAEAALPATETKPAARPPKTSASASAPAKSPAPGTSAAATQGKSPANSGKETARDAGR
jgi:hypothetical protein